MNEVATSLISPHGYYSYPSGPALHVDSFGWLEATDWDGGRTIFGRSGLAFDKLPLRPDHPDNAPFNVAQTLIGDLGLGNNQALTAAMRDFWIARRDPTAYSAFYSYRVLEDIASSFGDLEGNRKATWQMMNDSLGTAREDWEALQEVGYANEASETR